MCVKSLIVYNKLERSKLGYFPDMLIVDGLKIIVNNNNNYCNDDQGEQKKMVTLFSKHRSVT